MSTTIVRGALGESSDPLPAPVGSAPSPRSGRAWLTQLLLAGGLTLVWAALCNAVLNLLHTGGDVGYLLAQDVATLPGVFVVSTLILWTVVLLCLAVTGRLFASLGIVAALCLVAGYASHLKLQVRNEPLVPSDLSFVTETGFLMDMVTASSLIAALGAVLLILVVAVLCGRRLADRFPRIRRQSEPRLWWGWVGGRVALAIAALLTLAYVAQFNAPGNRVRSAYEASGVHWSIWHQKRNYLLNGAVAGFLYNLPTTPMEVPAGYSRERMARIAYHYERVAQVMDAERPRVRSLDDLNVVVVLSESFSDPTAVPGVELERDPIPFTRNLMETNPSGSLLAQRFGGGTANMEYESLTGLSISQFNPQHDTPYSMSVYDQSSYPSIVGHMKGSGHEVIGIHPFLPSMYKRDGAYRALGFDEFISEEALHEQPRIDNARFIADSAAFDETMIRMRESDGRDFVNLVTMQNHYPFRNLYDDPMAVSGVADAAARPLGHFARGLEHTDAAFESFLDELETWDEPTAVLLYGDHQPSLWDGDPEILANERAMYQAPFVMWTNTRDLPPRKAPLVSPIHFMPMLFDELDLEMPPFYALLTKLRGHVAAMENGRYYAPDGQEITDLDSDPELQELLEDYRLVQYDLAVGERYSLDRMFPQG